MAESSIELPPRYQPLSLLGKGGGGEVWAVRDLVSGGDFACKLLAESASEAEVSALVREALTLSGLEGLGAPRVYRFGRLRRTAKSKQSRPFLIRDLVVGESLGQLAKDPDEARRALSFVADAATALGGLHRAQVLHGDIKPENVIVGPSGVTLVDFGLSSAYGERGAEALGLTPKFAAPELLAGERLTIRAEVFALGATLREMLHAARDRVPAKMQRELQAIVDRATDSDPAQRFPSAEELAAAVRTAIKAPSTDHALVAAPWPIVGIDEASRELCEVVTGLGPSAGLLLAGPAQSGRTTLLRRVAWTLGVVGRNIALLETRQAEDPARALELELAAFDGAKDVTLLVDDFDALPAAVSTTITELRASGMRVVLTMTGGAEVSIEGPTLRIVEVAPLAEKLCRELVLRTAPSLPEAVVDHLVTLSSGWPGRLRSIVDRLSRSPVVTVQDVDRIVGSMSSERAPASDQPIDLERIRGALDRGFFEEAAELLAPFAEKQSLELAIARATLFTNQGDARSALGVLLPFEEEAGAKLGVSSAEWALQASRAMLREGDYLRAESLAQAVPGRLGEARTTPPGRRLEAESLATLGLTLSFAGRAEEAIAVLGKGVELARQFDHPRELAMSLGSLGFVLQKAERLAEAREAYLEALSSAERAGDAGSVATTRLNLATIEKMRGEIGETIAHLEAAVDMGKRSGRVSTLRHALLNLANLDLYVGRLAKAEAAIEELVQQRDKLPKQLAAQLSSLEAELLGKQGQFDRAALACADTRAAYLSLQRPIDAEEARLWGVVFALDAPTPNLSQLKAALGEARAVLEGTQAHGALLQVATARVALAMGDGSGALVALERAIESAEGAGLEIWRARALGLRAEIFAERGESVTARKDREEAVVILEGIASRLPRDLREVFWSDRERRELRTRTMPDQGSAVRSGRLPSLSGVSTHHSSHAREAAARVIDQGHLARILEINRVIAGTHDLGRLLERVTDHAIALVGAERGFVILKSQREGREGSLSVHASRGAEDTDPHARFSQSIAERVISLGAPIITTHARADAEVNEYVSVHRLMLESIACVPIRSGHRGVIGALYLETRLRTAVGFEESSLLLEAFADQVAIAIETARLLGENERRTSELAKTNTELAKAREELEDLLAQRTAQLSTVKRDLKSTRAVLRSHFGYEGLVGTSEAMRRLYALIDRVKDTDVPVLLLGESGTGKEMIARAIHHASRRAKKPFIGINCGAIPEHLLETELFGHVRGSFTSADKDRKGLFRDAEGGTILLDEIGEMPHKMQAGLLRVLQERKIRPVGSTHEEAVDTRVIAATHRDLQALVQAGAFREDLFYRLNVISVRVPSLHERRDDIPILIDHFLGIFAARYSRDRRSVSRRALRQLMAHPWPGNVRQLENALLNAWVLSDAPELEPEDFSLFESPTRVQAPPSAALPNSYDRHRNDEKDRMLSALASSNWNRLKAAEMLGIPRRTFYRRLKEYGIQ